MKIGELTNEVVYAERLRLAYELISDVLAFKSDLIPKGILDDLEEVRDRCDIDKYSLEEIQDRMNKEVEENQEEIIISCDASITRNPGGVVAVGFVIRFPEEDRLALVKMAKTTPSRTNNEGEYDAVYEALMFLFNQYNRPRHGVLIKSDSQLVVKQLTKEWQCTDERLERKRDSILELIQSCPVPVRIEWAPRNSTPDLAEANYLAQDKLQIRRH